MSSNGHAEDRSMGGKDQDHDVDDRGGDSRDNFDGWNWKRTNDTASGWMKWNHEKKKYEDWEEDGHSWKNYSQNNKSNLVRKGNGWAKNGVRSKPFNHHRQVWVQKTGPRHNIKKDQNLSADESLIGKEAVSWLRYKAEWFCVGRSKKSGDEGGWVPADVLIDEIRPKLWQHHSITLDEEKPYRVANYSVDGNFTKRLEIFCYEGSDEIISDGDELSDERPRRGRGGSAKKNLCGDERDQNALLGYAYGGDMSDRESKYSFPGTDDDDDDQIMGDAADASGINYYNKERHDNDIPTPTTGVPSDRQTASSFDSMIHVGEVGVVRLADLPLPPPNVSNPFAEDGSGHFSQVDNDAVMGNKNEMKWKPNSSKSKKEARARDRSASRERRREVKKPSKKIEKFLDAVNDANDRSRGWDTTYTSSNLPSLRGWRGSTQFTNKQRPRDEEDDVNGYFAHQADSDREDSRVDDY
eukprot:g14081.t1